MKLEKARLEREEREAREELEKEKLLARAAELKLKKQGVVHGDFYDAYTIEEIRKITNYDFLEKLCQNIYGPAQPNSDIEMEILNERYKVACDQLNEILVNEME